MWIRILAVCSLFFAVAVKAEQDDLGLRLRHILKENPEIVLDVIRENPGIISEAKELSAKAARENTITLRNAAIEEHFDTISQAENAPVLGNPDGDITIVEFFDYNCPYCKKLSNVLRQIIADDPNIRLVLREFPILSLASVQISEAALAAHKQGKYEAFHWALMAAKNISTQAAIMRIAQSLGLDIVQLERDMESPEIAAHLEKSFYYAGELNISGTPSLLIEKSFRSGTISVERFKSLIKTAREKSRRNK